MTDPERYVSPEERRDIEDSETPSLTIDCQHSFYFPPNAGGETVTCYINERLQSLRETHDERRQQAIDGSTEFPFGKSSEEPVVE